MRSEGCVFTFWLKWEVMTRASFDAWIPDLEEQGKHRKWILIDWGLVAVADTLSNCKKFLWDETACNWSRMFIAIHRLSGSMEIEQV